MMACSFNPGRSLKNMVWKNRVMSDSCEPVDCSPPGPSVGILQARTLEWVAMSFFQGIPVNQGSNWGLPHCRRILYHLSHQGSPVVFLNIY